MVLELLQQQALDNVGTVTAWQRVQIARHPGRPYTADYIKLICDDFFELRGDRRFGNDAAILSGLASVNGTSLMLIGHQKGRDLREKQECNFGMAHPEGYRKALRLMLQAQQLRLPVVTLVDTAGAYPGSEAEQRGIAQAIAENLFVMAQLRTPVLSIVIGEGGNGGALALGVADRILMLEYAIYTGPEAAASILWRDSALAAQAAEAMKITAPELLKLGLIDGIIPEPEGGAHHDYHAAAAALKDAMLTHLAALRQQSLDTLVTQRYRRLRAIGRGE